MEILLNELSLDGQFESAESFAISAIPPILGLFKIIDSKDLIYKNYEFYSRKVTSTENIHEVLTGTSSRTLDEIRRFKSYLANLFEEPYWESDQKHSSVNTYSLFNNNVNNTSIAEACERDKAVISFAHPFYLTKKLNVFKDEEEISIHNLSEANDYLNSCLEENLIDFADYCAKKFNGKTKLNFSNFTQKESFGLLHKENESVFLEAFQKFDNLSWQEIIVDDGLDYKAYDKKIFYKEVEFNKYKFRVTKKFRCFGYVESSVFYVLCFDLTHKLSD